MTIKPLTEDPRDIAQRNQDELLLDSFLYHVKYTRPRDMHPLAWRAARMSSVGIAILEQMHPLRIPKGDTLQRRSQRWRRARRTALAREARVIAALKRDPIVL